MKSNDIIYQIFPRNHSKEGTFKAIENDLDRIKELKVNIIYLMPIHEIGLLKRKGTYGSPYSIKDYFSISKDLGTKEDLISLINATHERNMQIIIDMVFNHTSRDNVLLINHEDYYYHKNGKLSNRVGDWTDIIDLDTFKKETQEYLYEVLKYYVDLGIDGFRFDVASMIPLSFFKMARERLGKDIIFIGESIDKDFSNYLKSIDDFVNDDKDMYPTFDSLYNYNYFHILTGYIKGKKEIDELIDEFNIDDVNTRLLCLENHDNDRISSLLNKEQLRYYLDFFSFIKGQVFIYAGQEYGNKHKPELFEKDPVDFSKKDEDILKMYISFIDKKLVQKEIIHQEFKKVDEQTIKVKVIYFDKTEEEKTFYLPQNK